MKKLFFTLFCVFALSVSNTMQSQHLTISTSGGDVGPISGTNWGISANVLYVGSSGSASINTSVITNHLQNTGNLMFRATYTSTILLPIWALVQDH